MTRIPAGFADAARHARPQGRPGRRPSRSPTIRRGPGSSSPRPATATRRPFPITMAYNAAGPAGDRCAVAGDHRLRGRRVRGQGHCGAGPRPTAVWLDPDSEVNRALNVRGVSVVPGRGRAGSAMLPPLLRQWRGRSTRAHFRRARGRPPRWTPSPRLPVEEQAEAWGDLDEEIMTRVLPGGAGRLRQPPLRLRLHGWATPPVTPSLGTPNYKDLYVVP